MSAVDESIESLVQQVLDDIERKTLVHFVREPKGGLRILAERQATSSALPAAPGQPSGSDLCCFGLAGSGLPAAQRSARRRLAQALLQALGVHLASGASANETASAIGITNAEADAVNALYADEVLPAASALPAVAKVGVWQLVQDYAASTWSDLLGGRGRRLIAGTMRWARSLKQAKGPVAALPTFSFHGNKAEVVLLGLESAELHMPTDAAAAARRDNDEGLGAGIRRTMLYARTLEGFVGGLPSYLGDGSLVLLRRKFTRAMLAKDLDLGPGTIDNILEEHRSAAALAHTARWALAHGAMLGIPSFVPWSGSAVSGGGIEVLLIGGTGSGDAVLGPSLTTVALRTADVGGPPPVLAGVLAAVASLGGGWLLARHLVKSRRHSTPAERALEEEIDAL